MIARATSLSGELREMARRSGLSQTEIVRRSDGVIDRTSLSRFLAGGKMSMPKLDSLASILGARIDFGEIAAAEESDIVQGLARLVIAAARANRKRGRSAKRAASRELEPCG